MKLSDDVDLDLQRLVTTRLLLQANSGGGKSFALRRILEQSHGEVQQIVIDVEDEFYTLREKFDYILVRKEGGDCVPEVRSAALLAHRLLELGVSAIISIYEMKQHERIAFVKAFLDALVNAPKTLWHPALIVVDEAHVFCPEKEPAESAGSVIDLMTRGRKRGFCGILATQRISKLAKDAAAEANNKLIGRAALDVDMKRAGDEIGFVSKEDRLSLRQLKPGEFFAFGPAVSDVVIPVKVGPVQTTHPKAGAGVTPVAPPKHKVQSVLAQLADLPQQAEEQHATIASLKTQVRELKTKLTIAERAQPKTETKIEKIPVLKDSQIARVEKILDRAGAIEMEVRDAAEQFAGRLNKFLGEPLRDALVKVKFANTEPRSVSTSPAVAKRIGAPEGPGRDGHKPLMRNRPAAVPSPTGSTAGDTLSVPSGGLHRIMISLAQRPSGLTQRQIGVRAGLSSKGGTFSTYISRARSNGWIEGDRNLIRITAAGIETLGSFEMLPEGELLYQYWLAKLGNSGAARILQALHDSYPDSLTKEEIGERAQISSAGGSFSTYLSRLRSLELISGTRELKASDELFD